MATSVKSHHSAAFRRHELSNLIQETFANCPHERRDHILWVIQNETKRDLYQRFHSKDRCQIIQELLHIGPLPDECIGKALVSALESRVLSNHERLKIANLLLLEHGAIPPVFLGHALNSAAHFLACGLVKADALMIKILSHGSIKPDDLGHALVLILEERASSAPQDVRLRVVRELLEHGTISSIYLGQALNLAVEQLDTALVTRIIEKGPIPESDHRYGASGARRSCAEGPTHKPDSWQEAVQNAFASRSMSILHPLLAIVNISTQARCQALIDAFRQSQNHQGSSRLDLLLDFVPNRRKIQHALLIRAQKEGLQELVNELTIYEAR